MEMMIMICVTHEYSSLWTRFVPQIQKLDNDREKFFLVENTIVIISTLRLIFPTHVCITVAQRFFVSRTSFSNFRVMSPQSYIIVVIHPHTSFQA